MAHLATAGGRHALDRRRWHGPGRQPVERGAQKDGEGEQVAALDRQIALMQQLRARTRPGDGAWRLPKGDEIYALALRKATTTDHTAEQVHKIGDELSMTLYGKYLQCL